MKVYELFLMLRVNLRVTIHLYARIYQLCRNHRNGRRRTRGGGDEETGFCALSETEHVKGAHEGGLDGLDRVELVMGRGGGTGQVVDLCIQSKDA